MNDTFVMANGQCVTAESTDQPASSMLVRTVGDKVCVSITLSDGNAIGAQKLAKQLDKCGYLPPGEPMTRDEWERSIPPDLNQFHADIIWQVCGLGVPLGVAVHRAGVPPAKHKNARRKIARKLKLLGWSSVEGE